MPAHPIFDEIENRWFHRHHDDHHTSAETPAATDTIEPNPQEDPMALLAELEADAKALAAKFETVDRDALAKLEAVQGNAEAMSVFGTLAAIAGMPGLPAGLIGTAEGVLRAVAAPYIAAAVPQPQEFPAGPQVAGQA